MLILRFQAVFEVDKEKGLKLIEIADNVDVQNVIESTECEFEIAEDLKPMRSI